MENRNKKGQFLKGIKNNTVIPNIGEKFGNYEVISNSIIYKNKDTHIHVKVRCKCGKENIIRYSFLKSGKRKQCKNCSSSEVYWKCRKLGKK